MRPPSRFEFADLLSLLNELFFGFPWYWDYRVSTDAFRFYTPEEWGHNAL